MRRLLLVLVGLLALLLAAGAWAGWHYSSQVVVPDHGGGPYDTAVRAVGRDRVVLERTHETLRPGIYGLRWHGGSAVAGPIVARDGKSVTRRLSAVRGRLAAGTQVNVEADVYDGTPLSTRGLPYRDVAVASELGPMPAWRIDGGPDTWAIVVHGINATRRTGLRIAPALHRTGLTSLLISYRDDSGAPSSPDGKHHLGQTEWRDLEAAARYALGQGARRVVLVGYSMGGALVTQFLQRSPLADRVAGVVLDAPALSWPRILAYNATLMHLPSVAALPVRWAVGARVDVDWDRLDALRHTGAFARFPILLFHGTGDRTVPIATSDDFARALPRTVTYVRVPGAGHIESWNVDPPRYEARLTAFLQEVRRPGSPMGRQNAARPAAANAG